MKDTKIALVQMKSKLNDKKSNLEKIKIYIKEAWENHVDIICFPEACINGYGKKTDPLVGSEIAELTGIFKDIAIDYQITILTGFIEEKFEDSPYITQMINTPDGKVGYYRKSHLGESEIGYFSRGNAIPIFETPTALIGVQICWETHFPELTSIMSLKGAEIIFTPFSSPLKNEKRKDIWMKYLPARAYDNALFVAACNLDGALAIDPKGNLIKENFQGLESIIYIELDSNIIGNIKDTKNSSMSSRHYMKHRRPELYIDILKDYKLR